VHSKLGSIGLECEKFDHILSAGQILIGKDRKQSPWLKGGTEKHLGLLWEDGGECRLGMGREVVQKINFYL
jgi:hypothetical protein